MNRFCFVHASDLRLDMPFNGVGRVPPAIADTLRDASLDAWDALVELTIDRAAAFLVLAGGLYDGPKRGIRARARLRAGLERLAERHVPVFVAAGPLDSLADWPRREWPSTVTLFGSEKASSVTVWRGGSALATLHGMSTPSGGFPESPERAFQRGAETGLQIGVLHARIAERGTERRGGDDLRRSGMDYWALGGIQERSFARSGDPWVVYPGTPQCRGPAEPGARGAVVVDVEDGAVETVAFVELDRVRCLRLTLDAEGQAARGQTEELLLAAAERLRQEHAGRTLLLEIELPEKGTARELLLGPAAREALLHELRRRVETWSPGVWWVGFRDPGETGAGAVPRCPVDLAREILARGRSLAENPNAAGRFLEARFEPLLSTWVATFEPSEVPAFFRDATDLAFRFLDAEDAS